MSSAISQDSIARVPDLVGRLYSLVAEMEAAFGRKFTPDGHLVGSLGEVIGAYHYGLRLLPASNAGFDAVDPCGRSVEIKATQVNRVAMRSCPEFLLVLQIHRDGSFTEYFNGPGSIAWTNAGKAQVRNGQRSISLSKLRRLMESVADADRLPRRSVTGWGRAVDHGATSPAGFASYSAMQGGPSDWQLSDREEQAG